MSEVAPRGLIRRMRDGLPRLAYLTILGLLLGGIVHLVAVLAMPMLAQHDAVSRFAELGSDGRAERVDALSVQSPVVDHDPATVMSACGFDLTDGPVRVLARAGAVGDSPFSLSIHRRGGGVAYAITDRAAVRGALEFVILTPSQLAERIAREDDGDSARELRVVLNVQQGIVLARALVRRSSDKADAEALVSDMACGAAD